MARIPMLLLLAALVAAASAQPAQDSTSSSPGCPVVTATPSVTSIELTWAPVRALLQVAMRRLQCASHR
jgi:hypothetical protein